MGTWFNTTQEGEKYKEHQEALREQKKANPFKWVLRFPFKIGASEVGKPIKIIFLDGKLIPENGNLPDGEYSPFYMDVHTLGYGSGKNYTYIDTLKCIKGKQPCSICNEYKYPDGSRSKSSFAGYYTIIDPRPYKKKDGTEVKFKRILFPAKGMAGDLLNKVKIECGGLVNEKGYAVVEVTRFGSGKDSPNCGNSFKYLGRISKEKLIESFGEENSVPYNYREVFYDPTPEELAFLGIKPISGSKEDIAEELSEFDFDKEIPLETAPEEISLEEIF